MSWIALVGCAEQAGGGMSLSQSGDDDIYAVRCIAFQGPERLRFAKRYEELLKRVQGLKPALVQVIHDDESSVLYYGRYRRRYDVAKDESSYAPDARAELDLIRTLAFADSPGYPFRLAAMEELPGAAVGNPAWELSKAKGDWSLHVAVFYNTQDMTRRKQAAYEYCKILREQGEEAYYHHGPAKSSVCIGAFPKAAVREVQEPNPTTGAIEMRAEIVDQRLFDLLLALQKKYPCSLENGHKIYDIQRDSSGKVARRSERPLFPVEIPHASAAQDVLRKP